MALRNLFGDLGLDATLQKISQYLQIIASTSGSTYPDTAGRMRVNIESGTLPTVSTVGTVNNVAAVGGFSSTGDQYYQALNGANYIRSRITTS
jgi:hypothetical protein